VVAVAALVVILLPASLWKSPANDAVYKGFDSNLLVTNTGGAKVSISHSEIDLAAPRSGQPTVNLATSLLPKLSATVMVTVVSNAEAAEPFRIGVWSPWVSSGLFVVFGPPPDDAIELLWLEKGSPSTTLVGGTAIESNVVGNYQLGIPYAVTLTIDRTDGYIGAYVTPPTARPLGAEIRRGRSDLFNNVQLSITASADAGQGASHVVLRNFTLTFPHERWWAVRLDDPFERALVLLIALTCAVLIGLAVVLGRRRFAWPRLAVSASARTVLVLAGALIVYLVGNAALFPLGDHPFDGHLEEMYAYVASVYGADHLYYLPNAVSLAKFFGGTPYVESAFPYGPTFAYMYSGIGWVAALLFGSTPPPGDVRIEYLIKSVNVLFGLADGLLIFLILRQIRLDRRWSYIAAALWLFNPAVWFSMSIWGQTHVISIFLILVAVLAIERNRPLIAWLALAAALMTRPQMVVFVFLLGVVLLRKFPVAVNVRALSWTLITNFLLLLPLSLEISPSLPVDVTLNNFVIQQAGGNAASLSTVSQDAYSIWPLVTYFTSGATGLERAFIPSSASVVGNLTYQRLGLILTVASLLVIAFLLAFRSRDRLAEGGYGPLVALGICSFVMLLTGVVATHFLLALPFLLLCRRWMGSVAYFYVAAIWTVTTLVPMYGDMAGTISPADYPALAGSALTRFVAGLYEWDRFITVAIVANVCALIWLAWLTFRRTPPTLNPT